MAPRSRSSCSWCSLVYTFCFLCLAGPPSQRSDCLQWRPRGPGEAQLREATQVRSVPCDFISFLSGSLVMFCSSPIPNPARSSTPLTLRIAKPGTLMQLLFGEGGLSSRWFHLVSPSEALKISLDTFLLCPYRHIRTAPGVGNSI